MPSVLQRGTTWLSVAHKKSAALEKCISPAWHEFGHFWASVAVDLDSARRAEQ